MGSGSTFRTVLELTNRGFSERFAHIVYDFCEHFLVG
jgi:hypothetical protein